MALLTFPISPTHGQIYPTTPAVGENQYQYDAPNQTWRLLGTATGVVPDTYGDATSVGQFTVDSTGKITFAQNVPIASLAGGTVTDVTAGVGLLGGTINVSGTIDLDTAYTDGRYIQSSTLPLPITQGGTGQTTATAAINALLPTQVAGNFLTTNGTNVNWIDPSLSLVTQALTPPANSGSMGTAGQVATDATYFYYYDGARWNRIAWDTTPW
jgi:hypothetical protein